MEAAGELAAKTSEESTSASATASRHLPEIPHDPKVVLLYSLRRIPNEPHAVITVTPARVQHRCSTGWRAYFHIHRHAEAMQRAAIYECEQYAAGFAVNRQHTGSTQTTHRQHTGSVQACLYKPVCPGVLQAMEIVVDGPIQREHHGVNSEVAAFRVPSPIVGELWEAENR